MKITRNTLRADGLTVGEAMDRDCAWLRSVGIDAPLHPQTMDEQREEAIDQMRNKVLDAIDSQAPDNKAWKDADLTALFKAIDPIAERLFWKRMGL